MAACGVTKLTGSTQTLVLVSDDNQDSVLRKQKRTISNRESARKSRIRKKKHMDDLVGQVCQLVSDNKCMAINLKDTTQMFIKLDSENSVLKAQLAELNRQFESLNEIINGFNLVMSDDHQTEASRICGVDDEVLLYCNNMMLENQHFMKNPTSSIHKSRTTTSDSRTISEIGGTASQEPKFLSRNTMYSSASSMDKVFLGWIRVKEKRHRLFWSGFWWFYGADGGLFLVGREAARVSRVGGCSVADLEMEARERV
ncbi:hypothetical protein LXL04_024616 [Taraxacum kok-saghyz]